MTEKRLYEVIDKAEPRGQSVTYEGIPCTARTCVTRLNRLTEENGQLQKKNDNLVHMIARVQYRADLIKEENEQLKHECNYLQNRLDDFINIQNENEQLKSTIKEVTELLSDEVDLFSDKATEHDINAYVELKELDNKDAYYMAIATKKAIKMLKELQE